MPRVGMSTIRYSCSVFTCAFRVNFSLSFPRKRLQWEKNHCDMFGCNNDRLSSERYTVEFFFLPEKRA